MGRILDWGGNEEEGGRGDHSPSSSDAPIDADHNAGAQFYHHTRENTTKTAGKPPPEAENRDDSDDWEPSEPTIRLDHFLKRMDIAATGGHAKLLIQSGEILVDGKIETRRRRQLKHGQVVEWNGESFVVEFE